MCKLSGGAKIRINDIGGSYKKICSVLGGMYIDIADKSVNLNPFQVFLCFFPGYRPNGKEAKNIMCFI
jgi:hypothetical protein